MKNNNTNCLNCKQILQGNFCNNCGQENIDIKITFNELVRDYLGDMFTYDSRFYRTIVPLLFKPGFLTKEYYEGRRIPYVPPLRLYLFISFVLFLWLALVDNGVNQGDPDTEELAQRRDELVMQIENSDVSQWTKDIALKALGNMASIVQNPDAFLDILSSRIPHLMFLLLPIFAVILWAHYPLSPFNYLQHLVFALHFNAFAYLLNFVLIVSNLIVTWSYAGWALLVFNIYLALALGRVYGSGKAGRILKTISILAFYLVILAISVATFVLLNILSFG